MSRETISEIRSILNIYSRILENKKLLVEQHIFGIDELGYNPVTKAGGALGYGYDHGYRVKNQYWENHDTHLHIGFTDKNTAMSVIDKAHEMGLRTTENPYAKTDPNGKVDNVHTSDSFHYRRFEGLPEVGKGVDISGNHQKLVELILWIEQTFAGNYVPPPTEPETETQQTQTSDNLATAGVLGAAALATYGIKKASDLLSSNKGNQQSTSTPTTTDNKSDYFRGKADKKKYGGKNEFPFSFFG